LLHDQEDLATRTSEVGRKTFMRDLRDLEPQDAVDLKSVAGRQYELARLLDRLLHEMDEMGRQMHQNDPETAATAADVLDIARRLAVSGQMNGVGGQIQKNQIGQASAGQKQIVRDLRKIVDALSRQAGSETHRAQESIKQFRESQEKIAEEPRQFHESGKSSSELTRAQASSLLQLAKSQREIQMQVEQLGEQATEPIAIQQELTGAKGEMGRAADSLDSRQTGSTTQQAQQNAIQHLDALLQLIERMQKDVEKNSPSENQQQANSSTDPDTASRSPSNPPNGSKAADKPGGDGTAKPTGDGTVGRPDSAKDARARMKKLWGELPEHVRERMRQSAAEDFPTKYEMRIEEYFRKLSEGKKQ